MKLDPKANWDFSTWTFEEFRRLWQCVSDHSEKSGYSMRLLLDESMRALEKLEAQSQSGPTDAKLRVVNNGAFSGMAKPNKNTQTCLKKMRIVHQ